MKFQKLLSFTFAAIFFAIPFISLPTAQADNAQKIILFDIPHRDLNGVFLDNSLDRSLLPTGNLGKLVFTPINQPRNWLIDRHTLQKVCWVRSSAEDSSTANLLR